LTNKFIYTIIFSSDTDGRGQQPPRLEVSMRDFFEIFSDLDDPYVIFPMVVSIAREMEFQLCLELNQQHELLLWAKDRPGLNLEEVRRIAERLRQKLTESADREVVLSESVDDHIDNPCWKQEVDVWRYYFGDEQMCTVIVWYKLNRKMYISLG